MQRTIVSIAATQRNPTSPLLRSGGPLQSIIVKTSRRTQLVDITKDVQRIVSALGVRVGTCFLYVPHTTAAILINEHADPDVASDAERAIDRLIPLSGPYRHAEGNSDSHVKTMLTGTTQFIFVEETKLVLGRWQGIFLAEFDGPRERKVYVKVLPDRV
jgi:secondary thiamine-phosphate synthase enzyme